MKAHLLHRSLDFELERKLPPHAEALEQDLGLGGVLDAMAAGDEYLRDVARRVLLAGLGEPDEIRYRQAVLQDCVEHPDVARALYDLSVAAIEGERRHWKSFLRYPDTILHRSIEVMDMFLGHLRRLRGLAEAHAGSFRSEGLRTFCATASRELSDEYLALAADHLRRLRFPNGALVSARLGRGNKGTDHVLRYPKEDIGPWWRGLRRWLPFSAEDPFTVVIPPRDEAGIRALSELRGRGINDVANALAQSADHLTSFFGMIRFELAFYLGCLNLRKRLDELGGPICVPEPAQRGAAQLTCRGLYDVGLALRVSERVVGNDVDGDGRSLVVITGANAGGKSTFLRSVGIAQLMMQSGMFVGAQTYRADVASGVFTHFKREEDPTLTSGKLDEELRRMSQIADRLAPHAQVLFNESFAATNEREGADISEAIVRALRESRVKVLFVTHSYELARRWYAERDPRALFLRAERLPDGTRTFRQIEGEPLPTSYGRDLYESVFASPIIGARAMDARPGAS